MTGTEDAELGRLFTDPRRPHGVLGPGDSGAVCRNLRTVLGVPGSLSAEARGDAGAYPVRTRFDYGKDVGDGVRDFQASHGHPRPDGLFGPGTRTLLIRTLTTPEHAGITRSLLDPVACDEIEALLTDPEAPDQILEPFHAGLIGLNIRRALSSLGIAIAESTSYDEELGKAIRRLQAALGHRCVDGRFGPGTRRLLACRVAEVLGDGGLARAESLLHPSMPPPPVGAYAGTEPAVFLSYAHRDAHTVFEDVAALSTRGSRIWYDEGIPAMAVWDDELRRRIETSAGVLVYVSPRSVRSPEVRREIGWGLQAGKPVLPVFLIPPDLAAYSAAFGPALARIQAVYRYRHPPEKAILQIETVLRSFGAGP